MINETDSSNPQATGPSIDTAVGPSDPRAVSRRWLLFKAGVALNGVVGLVLAVPDFPLPPCALEERRELQLLDLARPARHISHGRNAPRVL